MTYKAIIKGELSKNLWELIKIDSLGEWWEEEYWRIQWRHNNGLILFVQFLIDPMDSSSVWEIRASKDLIRQRISNSEISKLNMSRGKFNVKLSQFIQEIEAYRKNSINKKAD
ncbi:MAG: hypothetical protein AAFX55_06990 [Bacteroidota bacterium]